MRALFIWLKRDNELSDCIKSEGYVNYNGAGQIILIDRPPPTTYTHLPRALFTLPLPSLLYDRITPSG
jgi:hypothetical protein